MRARPSGSIHVFGALALIVVAALVAAAVGAGAAGLHALSRGVGYADGVSAVARDPLLLALAQLAGLVVATGAGVLAAFGSDVTYREALDVRPVPAAIAVLALTAGLSLQFPLHELANLLAELDPSLGMDEMQQRQLRDFIRIDSALEAVTVPLAVVAIPALSEELLFRGLLLPGLAKRYHPTVGLVLSSVLFGLIHWAPVAVAYATVAGFALGWMRLKTGSVLPCIAMHGAFNAVPVLLPVELVRIEGFNTVGGEVYHLPLPLVVGAAVVAGACFFVIMRLTEEPEE
ncbi:MAG TPA: CPBP family intramembrane glutamic endopeptidase [Sandaracinaceae bacterium LLY-WYZ-13_1]|nr:CPBP family intramembrane glutamic endopeptidase [Sandaracinaceae bacterium LLY-WYZ-13_1]